MKNRTLELFRLEVTLEDIVEMYDRYDSGMADHTTANAISLALRKKLRSDCIPRIISVSDFDDCRVQVGQEFFPLSKEAYGWLDMAGRGCSVSPTAFPMILPKDILQIEATATGGGERAFAA